MLSSVAKIPYESATGGVLNNVTISPEQLEEGEDGSRAESLQMMLDEVFSKGGQHLSLNIVDKEALLHALDHPFDSVVVCHSGYQVEFNALSAEQKQELLARINH
mmetsp:Transcript_43502/g.72499  ORF Transcript_43502/g.72499 Transcript_43502/m.72499 type:complete len:105 (-) Transcript_43502:435-749(-)